jgi:hypothetical protein
MAISILNLNRGNQTSADVRPLQVYAFDPTLGRGRGNHVTLAVPYEPLQPGPTGRRLQVVDYDSTNDRYYPPVKLDVPRLMLQGGLQPSESNPQFHQQMVYAVASETIRHFEFALGRPAKWGFRRTRNIARGENRLRLLPHGAHEANAYYSRKLKGIVFGYFQALDGDAGSNIPGQLVFTCLSHDIIAHEMTHALIDGQRSHFLLPTGFDTPAFHEGFADIVALLQHFSFKEALLDTVQRTAGKLHRADLDPVSMPIGDRPMIAAEMGAKNSLVELAKQFGEAMGKRAALRSALGRPPDPRDLDKLLEPHERGAILVAAVFDAFFSAYLGRTRDLLRIARAGGASVTPGELHPSLVERLASDASKAADQFLNVCIRALDYCPPVDITFGDFLRAMITADADLVPDDDLGYRDALIRAFRLRGIYPDGARTMSEESLRWTPFDGGRKISVDLTFDLAQEENDELEGARQGLNRRNAIALNAFGDRYRSALGLVPRVPIAAHTWHLVSRVGPDGQLVFEVVAELIQKKDDQTYGGTTVLFNGDGTVRYAIAKPAAPPAEEFKEHLRREDVAGIYGAPRDGALKNLDFRHLHGGF